MLTKTSRGLALISTASDVISLGVAFGKGSKSWMDIAKYIAIRGVTNIGVAYGTSYLLGYLPQDGYALLGVLLLLQGYSLFSNSCNIYAHTRRTYDYYLGKRSLGKRNLGTKTHEQLQEERQRQQSRQEIEDMWGFWDDEDELAAAKQDKSDIATTSWYGYVKSFFVLA